MRVARTRIDVDAGERGEAPSELTDVYVEKLFADELAHQ